VGCGVCDTPELWRRGAAGLCARVHASAGAAESLHTYMGQAEPVSSVCRSNRFVVLGRPPLPG